MDVHLLLKTVYVCFVWAKLQPLILRLNMDLQNTFLLFS